MCHTCSITTTMTSCQRCRNWTLSRPRLLELGKESPRSVVVILAEVLHVLQGRNEDHSKHFIKIIVIDTAGMKSSISAEVPEIVRLNYCHNGGVRSSGLACAENPVISAMLALLTGCLWTAVPSWSCLAINT